MSEIQTVLIQALSGAIGEVFASLGKHWVALSLAILIAALCKVFIDAEKLKDRLLEKPRVSILAAVLFGALTPLCACGTMAVMLGMLTTALPWGAVMAFLTSSPLMSPEGFVMLSGVIGTQFAVGLTVASIILGLVSGYLTHLIEQRSAFLKDQTRFAGKTSACGCGSTAQTPASCACSSKAPAPEESPEGGYHTEILPQACGCATAQLVADVPPTSHRSCECLPLRWAKSLRLGEIYEALVEIGFKQILPFFCLFVGIGYLINFFVPTEIIIGLFSAKNVYSVPLAALIGLPLYVTTESAVPLIKAVMDSGASGGAMMAFMITGQATSAWVIGGLATFMKSRVLGLYIAYVLIGGIVLGYLYDFALRLFA